MKMVNAELYFQRKHSLIGEGRPVTLGGIEHRTEVYETENGRRHLCFLKGSERPTSYSSRLGVFVDPRDSSVSLLGMIVNDKLRGSGAGKAIAQYFLEYANDTGLNPVNTSIIRKPIIALTLARTGFTPEEGGVLVGLLPQLSSDISVCPRITPLNPSSLPADVVDRSEAGKFYEVVGEESLTRQYPVFNPYTPVTIHTQYRPPKKLTYS